MGEPIVPIGDVGRPRCKCGAAVHARYADRCASGHPLVGTAGPGLVTAARSATFWAAIEDTQREIERQIIADAGHTAEDAPRTLQLAAAGLAQAALLRDSSFQRVVESGGPLTSADRGRRCLVVWQIAADRVERYLRVLGLKRVPRPATSPLDFMKGASL
jgi:hypothetical protein